MKSRTLCLSATLCFSVFIGNGSAICFAQSGGATLDRGVGSGGGGGTTQLVQYVSGTGQTSSNVEKPSSTPKSKAKLSEHDNYCYEFTATALQGIQVLFSLHYLGFKAKDSKGQSIEINLADFGSLTDRLNGLCEGFNFKIEYGLSDFQSEALIALNDPTLGTIRFNPDAWREDAILTQRKAATLVAFERTKPQEFSDPVAKAAILSKISFSGLDRQQALYTREAVAAHEILSLLGIESDRMYPLSSVLFVAPKVTIEEERVWSPKSVTTEELDLVMEQSSVLANLTICIEQLWSLSPESRRISPYCTLIAQQATAAQLDITKLTSEVRATLNCQWETFREKRDPSHFRKVLSNMTTQTDRYMGLELNGQYR